jgi:hypothetical protein
MGHPVEINALFFALKDGSSGTEIVFLRWTPFVRQPEPLLKV